MADPSAARIPVPSRTAEGRWDLREAVACQRRLRDEVIAEDRLEPVRSVAGVDVAYSPTDERMVAGVVLVDASSLEPLETVTSVQPVRFPYVPGFLSFRESPAILEALARLTGKADLLMVDGHGLAHPRGFGIACHLGVLLDLPTVGVAKSVLVGRSREPGAKRGSRRSLVHRGETVGSVVRTRSDVAPVYVSVGHRISLATAIRWVLRCGAGYRLPEPTRRAHLAVGAAKAGRKVGREGVP